MMTIGETFRYFRKSKNFTLGEVAQNIVTVPFLSRFERNQTDISVSRFFELLACIDVTIEEFFSIYNNSSNHEFFEKLNLYFQSENIQGLQQMRDNLLTEYHNNQITKKHLQAIMISALLQRVTGEKVKESDARFLQDYLLKLNNWTFFELVLYANTMFLFNIEIVLLLTKRLFKKSLMYEGVRKDNISNTVIILNNTVLSCIENDRFNEGFEILQILKDYIHDEKDFYSKYKYMYLNGVLMYCSGNKQVGISLLKEAVNILKILDSKNLITLEFNYLSHFLSENDLKEIFNGYSWLHFN